MDTTQATIDLMMNIVPLNDVNENRLLSAPTDITQLRGNNDEVFVCVKNSIFTFVGTKLIFLQKYSPVGLAQELLQLHKLGKHVIYR